MSRNIDLTKKLTEKDREYLESRGRTVEIARNDAQFAGEGSKGPEEAPTPEQTDAAGSEAASTQDAPALPGAQPEGDVKPDYESMKVEDLKAELDRRKKAYEEAEDEEGVAAVTYSSADKKADLVFMLNEDDSAVSEEDDEETA